MDQDDATAAVAVNSEEDLLVAEDDDQHHHAINTGDEPVLGQDTSGESVNAAEEEAGTAGATATTAGNVDSECESDDEWNYVKPTTTTSAAAEEQPKTLAETAEHLLLLPQAEQEQEKAHHENYEEEDHHEAAEKATREQDDIHEQHAEAQAIAESQEDCAEVSGCGWDDMVVKWGILFIGWDN